MYQAEQFLTLIRTAEFLKNLWCLMKNNCRQSANTFQAGRAVDVLYLNSSKAFDTASHSMHRLAMGGLQKCTVK